jgi:hypothetical protein
MEGWNIGILGLKSGFRSNFICLILVINPMKTDLIPPNPVFQHSIIPLPHGDFCGKGNLL